MAFFTLTVTFFVYIASDIYLDSVAFLLGLLLLVFIIFTGVVFDVIGMASASADSQPFHSMAAKKIPGAKEAVRIVDHADLFSAFCNDVIGDICGTISGAVAAVLVFRFVESYGSYDFRTASAVAVALVASFTVGGKAVGKTIAISKSHEIIFAAGRFIHYCRRLVVFLFGGMKN